MIHWFSINRAAATAALAVATLLPAAASQAAFEQKNVLFIGNSYTYNAVGYDGVGQKNPPYTTTSSSDGTASDRYFIDSYTSPFESLVAAAGAQNGVSNPLGSSQNIAVGGRRLNQHTGLTTSDRPTILFRNLNANGTDYDILNPAENGGIVWDTIVIQEYSTIPGQTIHGVGDQYNYSASAWDAFYTQGISPIADKIKQYAVTNGVAPEIVLFNTWGRAPGAFASGSSDEAKLVGFDSYEQMRDRTDEAYLNALNLLIAPTDQTGIVRPDAPGTTIAGKGFDADRVARALVSQAFDVVINDPNRPATLGNGFTGLYEDDHSHQAPYGEFLTAAVLFETIYRVPVYTLVDSMQLTGLSGGNDDFNTNYSLDLNTVRYLARVSASVTQVPEPASVLLLGAGLALVWLRRRAACRV